MWNVNVKSQFYLIKESLPLLRAAGKGANICITSSVSGRVSAPAIGIYSMTKAALDNMVEWMSFNLRDDGIRVTGIAPGLIATDLAGALWKDNKDLPEGSLGKPE